VENESGTEDRTTGRNEGGKREEHRISGDRVVEKLRGLLRAIGAIAAMVGNCWIEVERTDDAAETGG